jgi:hypothetical protein
VNLLSCLSYKYICVWRLGYGLEVPGFRSRRDQEIVPFLTISVPVGGPIIQSVRGFFLRKKAAEA